ncbi:hypothetical protein BCR34DRAFT_66137 [Clohesyomyces aquaticus]|uniref:Uncharacterized protein n=1 Tax=Clohesyomyces aquaticus TaxID=1231657 RepID=A0A1Y1Z0Y1_9PLEO|nr:hypothetical protein BCR34DRAFT_66137 [Clohesyomyces aquaticus]
MDYSGHRHHERTPPYKLPAVRFCRHRTSAASFSSPARIMSLQLDGATDAGWLGPRVSRCMCWLSITGTEYARVHVDSGRRPRASSLECISCRQQRLLDGPNPASTSCLASASTSTHRHPAKPGAGRFLDAAFDSHSQTAFATVRYHHWKQRCSSSHPCTCLSPLGGFDALSKSLLDGDTRNRNSCAIRLACPPQAAHHRLLRRPANEEPGIYINFIIRRALRGAPGHHTNYVGSPLLGELSLCDTSDRRCPWSKRRSTDDCRHQAVNVLVRGRASPGAPGEARFAIRSRA